MGCRWCWFLAPAGIFVQVLNTWGLGLGLKTKQCHLVNKDRLGLLKGSLAASPVITAVVQSSFILVPR